MERYEEKNETIEEEVIGRCASNPAIFFSINALTEGGRAPVFSITRNDAIYDREVSR